MLSTYLEDEERSRRIVERATPRYTRRFHLFGMNQSDYDDLIAKENQMRKMSPKDPFATIPSRNDKPEF